MNCHSFESVINDIARNQMMDAATKSAALAHADTCARCKARLDDEKMLSAGLRSLAVGMEKESAPPRIEAMLRAALRDKEAVAAPRPRRLPRLAIAAAIIGVILALVALVALNIKKTSATEQAGLPDVKKESKQEAAPAPDSQARSPFDHTIAKEARPDNSPFDAKPARRVTAGNGRNQKSAARPVKSSGVAGAREIATDFIPLVHSESLNQMDGGQVVRVELPRSALMRFGLPMNMERAYERVKADVVIGNDGLARAIRFVR